MNNDIMKTLATVTSALIDLSTQLESILVPDTDFEVGDRVIVAHVKKSDGQPKETYGNVIEVLGKDDDGYYTRIAGDNGKHYKVGLKEHEVRKGTCAILDENNF